MVKVGIIYFSGTGNTKFIATEMGKELRKKNIMVEMINIEKEQVDYNKYSHIIVGGPNYVERYPEILLQYLEKNLVGFKGQLMMFVTQGSEIESPVFKHALNRLDSFKVTYFDFIPMPTNFYNFMFKKTDINTEENIIKNSIVKARSCALEFIEGNNHTYEMSLFRAHLADFIYKLTFPLWRKLMTKSVKVDYNKCINCKICENKCPTNSIKIKPKLVIGDQCAFCQRCFHSCPKNAFTNKGKPFDQYKLKV